MASTQEQQVAALANKIVAVTAQLYGIGQEINFISSQWTNLSAANKLNAFPTAAPTTTGGIGISDGTPVTSDPINTGISPGSELNVAISANNIASLLTFLQNVSNCISGQAVSANGAAAQLVALCLAP